MANKPSKKLSSQKAGINIGGPVSHANIIQGDGNVINLPPDVIKINTLHQLPPAIADFTGREDLLKEILTDFETSKGASISGLTGLGGIGKTALGLQVAHQLKDRYVDAQIFLDLKGTTTPLTALDIVRHVVLAFMPSADLRGLDESNMLGMYHSVLEGKRTFLFFDNAGSAEQVAKLIPPKTCALIVTSRRTFPVAGLNAHKVGVLNEKEAVEFLLELAPRIAGHAAQLAKACGFLPLALRIAGSYLQVNPNVAIDTYLQDLKNVKSRLDTFSKNHQHAELTSEPDVFATFELSYAQLSESQQEKWQALGIFSGSFNSLAVGAIWEMQDEKEAQETLSLLMRYSLIDFNPNTSRYELHDLLAEFAGLKLNASEKRNENNARLARWLINLFEDNFEMKLESYPIVLPEKENLLHVCEWARGEERAEILALLTTKTRNWFYVNFNDSWIYWFAWLEASLQLGIADKQLKANVLQAIGDVQQFRDERDEALESYNEALKLFRQVGAKLGEANVRKAIGDVQQFRDERDEALESYNEALKLFRQVGDKLGEANTLQSLGKMQIINADSQELFEAGMNTLQSAMGLYEEVKDMTGQINILIFLSRVSASMGQIEKAIEISQSALKMLMQVAGDNHPVTLSYKEFIEKLEEEKGKENK